MASQKNYVPWDLFSYLLGYLLACLLGERIQKIVIKFARFKVLIASGMKIALWDVVPFSLVKVTNVSEVNPASIIRALMETVCTSKISVCCTYTGLHCALSQIVDVFVNKFVWKRERFVNLE